MLYSLGPERRVMSSKSAADVIRAKYEPAMSQYFFVYDPSNGTLSVGYIIRTNKGSFPD